MRLLVTVSRVCDQVLLSTDRWHLRRWTSSTRDVAYLTRRQRCRRYPAMGKVTVGLALHWPRVTDFSGLSTYGLAARKEGR